MITRPCDYCQEPYQADQRYLNRGQGQFCSRSCAGKNKAKNTPEPKPNVSCGFCGKAFYLKKSRRKSKSGLYFCSKGHQDDAYREGIITPGPKPRTEEEKRVFNYKDTYITSRVCLHCGKRWQSKYEICTPCELDLRVQAWLDGDNSVTMDQGATKETKKFVKEHLIATRGDKCEVCGWDEKAPDGRSIIQMDHIDGNCMNNLVDNLQLLCPNHHAMTPNYGSLNKGSGRAHRRKYG